MQSPVACAQSGLDDGREAKRHRDQGMCEPCTLDVRAWVLRSLHARLSARPSHIKQCASLSFFFVTFAFGGTRGITCTRMLTHMQRFQQLS